MSELKIQSMKTLVLEAFLCCSLVKKVRMGKRIEKAFGKDKGQASQSSQEVEEDPNKTPGIQTLPFYRSRAYSYLVKDW